MIVGTWHPRATTRSILHGGGSVLSTAGSILHTAGPILHTPVSILHTPVSILHTAGSVLHRARSILYRARSMRHTAVKSVRVTGAAAIRRVLRAMGAVGNAARRHTVLRGIGSAAELLERAGGGGAAAR
jgi:hypothetical protein